MTAADAEPVTLGGDYPTSWDDVFGQEKAKTELIEAAQAARALQVPMDHTLIISGSPGVGKTTLALLTAEETGGRLTVATGKIKPGQARILLSGMRDGDVLFIDEIHSMVAGGGSQSEWLLNFLHDGVLMGPRGMEEMPKVTVLAATTDPGRLKETLLERFAIVELEPYTDEQADQIAAGMAKRVLLPPLPLPSKENCARVARAASNNPRLMRTIWRKIRNTAIVNKGNNWDGQHYDVDATLDRMGLTPDGLNLTARRYLLALLETFAGEPAGAGAMQDVLREPGGLHYVERLLMDKDLVTKTKQGRCLTTAGVRRARQLQPGA